MGRALWIAFTAIFASLLLYLAFVGHREQVVRVAANLPDMLSGITQVVERISLPGRHDARPHSTAEIPDRPVPKVLVPARIKPVEKPLAPAHKKPAPKQVKVPAMALSDVGYDVSGQLVLGGKTDPDSTLEFYIDGVEVKPQRLETDGSWKLVVPREVGAGQHRLEVAIAPRPGRSRLIVVMPFVKARPEEVAALSLSRQKAKSRKTAKVVKPAAAKPQVVASSEKPDGGITGFVPSGSGKKDLLEELPSPVRRTSPGFSKLAELARSQSVKSDVDPLVGILPKLMIGDGPSLATPQIHRVENKRSEPGVSSVPEKAESEKPARTEPDTQKMPVVLLPRSIEQKSPEQKKINRLDTLRPKLALKNKTESGGGAPLGQNSTAAGNAALPDVSEKAPYTGYRKVNVAAGKGLVVVQPGNTLWDLAISIYGSGRYYQKLYRANRRIIKNPQRIFPGQIIFAPGANPPTSIAPISPPQWWPPQ